MTRVRKLLPAGTGLLLSVLLVACGGSAQDAGSPEEPVSVRFIVTAVDVSEDGKRVESINVRTEGGKELLLKLSTDIDPALWSPQHLQGHVQSGKLGIGIGVTYVDTAEGKVALELFE